MAQDNPVGKHIPKNNDGWAGKAQEFEQVAESVIRNVHEMGMSDQLIGIQPHYYLEQLRIRIGAVNEAHQRDSDARVREVMRIDLT